MEPTQTPKFPFATAATVAIVIFAVALGGWWFTRDGGMDGGMMEEKNETSSSPSTMKDILAYKGSQKCTFEESNDLSRSSGVFYVADGKGRGDFESTVLSGPAAGTVVKSHMIIEGDVSYVWSDTEKQGMKMSLAQVENTTPEQTPPGAPTGTQLNESHSYDCGSWDKDASRFVLPADVTFTDMNEMMKGMMEGMPKMETGTMPDASATAGVSVPANMGDMMAAQCGACDQAGEAREQCRAALGCK